MTDKLLIFPHFEFYKYYCDNHTKIIQDKYKAPISIIKEITIIEENISSSLERVFTETNWTFSDNKIISEKSNKDFYGKPKKSNDIRINTYKNNLITKSTLNGDVFEKYDYYKSQNIRKLLIQPRLFKYRSKEIWSYSEKKMTHIVNKRKSIYQFNESNQIRHYQATSRNGQIENEKLFNYNKDNNLIEIKEKSGKEINFQYLNGFGEFIYTVKSNNEITENIHFIQESSKLFQKYFHKDILDYEEIYNLDGSLISKIYYEGNSGIGERIDYKYEYDEKGNWIKMTEVKNQKTIQKIFERNINYA